jgi:hypothetical protein
VGVCGGGGERGASRLSTPLALPFRFAHQRRPHCLHRVNHRRPRKQHGADEEQDEALDLVNRAFGGSENQESCEERDHGNHE